MIETKSEAKGNFVGYLGIKNYSQIKRNLILPTVQNFFDAQEIQNFKAIDEHAGFADLDFNRNNFSDFFANFYDFIVNDIQSVGGGEFPLTITYCVTLDETNCSKTCEKTKIRYDEILLYKKPVFYFIYVDIKDVFACLRAMIDD